MLPDAAEEMVRWVSPVKHFFRTAVADYEIRGKTIKAGDSIFISYPSGNRDVRPPEGWPRRTLTQKTRLVAVSPALHYLPVSGIIPHRFLSVHANAARWP